MAPDPTEFRDRHGVVIQVGDRVRLFRAADQREWGEAAVTELRAVPGMPSVGVISMTSGRNGGANPGDMEVIRRRM